MIGTGELILIFAVVLLLFGEKKLPELARSVGNAVREFKKAQIEEEYKDKKEDKKEDTKLDEKEDKKDNKISELK